MKRFLERLARHKRLLVALAVAIGLCLGWTLLYNREAEVVAFILVNRPQHVIRPSVDEHFEFGEFVEIQRQLISSPFVVLRALRSKPGLPSQIQALPNPVEYVSDHIETSLISPKLIEVRLTGRKATAEERVKLLDAIVGAYIKEYQSSEITRKHALLEQLVREKDRIENELRRATRQLAEVVNDDVESTMLRTMIEAKKPLFFQIVSRIAEIQANSSTECIQLASPATIRDP